MIGRLTGQITSVGLKQVIVDVHGVGYDVAVPAGTVGRLDEDDGDQTQTLEIYTAVRDDSISLYGFASAREKKIFEQITSISRIGPKLGLGLLSQMRPDDIIRHTRSENEAAFTEVSGIGDKTAKRLVLELHSKLDKMEIQGQAPGGAATLGEERRRELRSALQNLGYDNRAITQATKHLESELSEDRELETLVRKALDILT